jgi:hypothetical protein
MELTLVLLGPTNDDGRLIEIVEQIDTACGQEADLDERPRNDYLPGRLTGQFSAVLELTRSLKALIGSDNIHHPRPELWNFSVLLLYGRRTQDPIATANRSNVSSNARIRIEVASYDRLTDKRVSSLDD